MNFLVDDMPTKINVSGEVVDIDYSYKNCSVITMALEDENLTDEEKCQIVIDRLYEKMPKDLNEAYKKAIMFLNQGDMPETQEAVAKSKKVADKRMYSFTKDGNFIFSAVDRVLNGRLSKGEDIHWWLFSNAFMEIPEDCMMSTIISMRIKKATGQLTKEEKKYYYKNIDIMRLKPKEEEQLTTEQDENVKKFWDLFNKKGN